MEEILVQNAQAFASQHELQLAERLGFGIHGIISVAEDKSKAGKTALKVHRSVEPYLREREVYQRLRDTGVSEILGFNVPQLIRFDDELRIIEMSIVTRPFILDFAGAWLDTPPDFPDETWLGSGEARAVRHSLAKGASRSGSVGGAGHSYGGCIAQQHRVPRLSGWLIPGRATQTTLRISLLSTKRAGSKALLTIGTGTKTGTKAQNHFSESPLGRRCTAIDKVVAHRVVREAVRW